MTLWCLILCSMHSYFYACLSDGATKSLDIDIEPGMTSEVGEIQQLILEKKEQMLAEDMTDMIQCTCTVRNFIDT